MRQHQRDQGCLEQVFGHPQRRHRGWQQAVADIHPDTQRFYHNPRDGSIRPMVNYDKCVEMTDDGHLHSATCAPDRYVSGSGKEGEDWKYTPFTGDPDCLNNWGYYEKDGKTLIKGGIAGTTMERDTKLWCPINTSKTGRQKFDYSSRTKRIYLKKDRSQVFAVDGDMNVERTKVRLRTKEEGKQAQIFAMPNSKVTDVGLTCDFSTPSRPADCPDGYTNMGATCERLPVSKSSSVNGKGAFETANCPKGYNNNGTSWRDYKSFTTDSYNCVGEQCKGPCDKKYGTQADPWPCEKDKLGARAYPSCKSQARYKKLDFADEYKSGGAFCALAAKSIPFSTYATCPTDYPKRTGALCYIDCEKKYGKGFYNNGTSCWWNNDTKGVDAMFCKPGEFKKGALCYQKCPPNYDSTGEFCHRNKKRVVDFSKKS